jgi:hypothetical protein
LFPLTLFAWAGFAPHPSSGQHGTALSRDPPCTGHDQSALVQADWKVGRLREEPKARGP